MRRKPSADDTVTLALNVGPVPVRFSRRTGHFRRDDAARPGVWRGAGPGGSGPADRARRGRPRPRAAAADRFHRNRLCHCRAAFGRGTRAAAREAAGGHALAARARSALVLRAGAPPGQTGARPSAPACSSTAARIRPPARPPAAPSATWWRAAPWHRTSASSLRQGVEMGRPSDLFLSAQSRIGEGHRCARRGQHRSCCNGTAFPAVMHMLSTDFHHGK